MAKIYSFEEYKIRRLIRENQEDLLSKIDYCDRNGYLWTDHYSIKMIGDRIEELKKMLEDLKNEKSS
jgi:hypothetical protein